MQLFNQRGLHKVTARVICQELEISPGSFSYHFPDKRELVQQLYQQLEDKQKKVFEEYNNLSGITDYLHLQQDLFLIQRNYQFFYLNLFEILNDFSDLALGYKTNLYAGRENNRNTLYFFMNNGVLKPMSELDLHQVIDRQQILLSSWLQDAELMTDYKSDEDYLRMYCDMLEPYLSDDEWQKYHDFFRNR